MEIKHILIIVVILGLVTILILPGGSVAEHGKINNCGSDMGCFIKAGEDCTKAKVVTNSSGNEMVMGMEGMENGFCIMGMEITNVNINSPGFEIYPESVKQSSLLWKGKSMECRMPLEYEKYGDVTSALEYCEGDLKNAIEDTMSLLVNEVSRVALINPACIRQTLWETSFSSYVVDGIVTHEGEEVCQATYAFGNIEAGRFKITHFFDMESENVEIEYSSNVDREGGIDEWCLSSGWDMRQATGTATSSGAKIIESGGEQFCHMQFIVLPASEYLPGISAEVYLDTGTQTAIRMQTTMGNTVERVFGV